MDALVLPCGVEDQASRKRQNDAVERTARAQAPKPPKQSLPFVQVLSSRRKRDRSGTSMMTAPPTSFQTTPADLLPRRVRV